MWAEGAAAAAGDEAPAEDACWPRWAADWRSRPLLRLAACGVLEATHQPLVAAGSGREKLQLEADAPLAAGLAVADACLECRSR